MPSRPITPHEWFPVHCAVCTQAGIKTPATWLVSTGQGRASFHACDAHRELLETRGRQALHRGKKRRPV